MLLKEPHIINEEFNGILDEIENNDSHVFVTGRAGTGKSTLLNLLKNTTQKNKAVVAPTGIAALNVGGQTIHSFFKIPPRMINPHELTKRKNHSFYKKLKLLIIDEISMVRADVIDCIDIFLRNNREDPRPFGGVQLVVFGDLFQLPPVISSPFERNMLKEKYESPYFFSAEVFREIDLQMIELHQVFRQKEGRFIKLLDNIRTRSLDYEVMEEINTRFVEDEQEDTIAITLCSTNAAVKSINTERLKVLQSAPYEFVAKMTGNFNPNFCSAEQYLWLKVDAQVMFVRNDPTGAFVNGTLGRIENIDHDKIIVQILDAGSYKSITVERMEWEMMQYQLDPKDPSRYTTKVVGTCTQFPLKLAWAITIHKSQGKTFDNVIIDLGRGAFDFGQTYVALSRCRTLDGIRLKKKIRPKDIIVDQIVIDFYETMKRMG